MTELTSYSPFEEEVRAVLVLPQARPKFVESLRGELRRQAAVKAAQPRRAPGWCAPGLQPRWAVPLLVLLVLAVSLVAVGPQRVLAAFRSLFGYLPGVGVVEDASLRILAEPVTVERDGITIQVEEGAADELRTILIYTADGLSVAAANSQGEAAATGGLAVLLLPDGSFLTQTGGEGRGWGTGYRLRLVFPPLPEGVDECTLMISRLESMPSGVAPEDWRIDLRFIPPPADLELLPVYELLEPQATETPLEQTAAPVDDPFAPHGIRFSLDRVAEMEDGFLLQGRISWEGQDYSSVMFDPYLNDAFSLLDAEGHPIPFETADPDVSGQVGEKTHYWALRTNSKAYPGPWTLGVVSLSVYQAVTDENAVVMIDFGESPQIGQSWTLDQTIEVAGHSLRAISASMDQDSRSGYPVLELVFDAGDKVLGIAVQDPLNQPENPGQPIGVSIPYSEAEGVRASIPYYKMPVGVHQLHLVSIQYTVSGNWQATWMPPEISSEETPVSSGQPCLTLESWQQALDAPAALPDGLAGRLLVVENTGQLMPQLSLVNLDGSDQQMLVIGGWPALSSDGSMLAYIESDGAGLMLLDVASGGTQLVPGTVTADYHPEWSPDGQWLAFVRSNDGLYISQPDGSGLRQVADASKIRFLAGWLPDNRTLVMASLVAEGTQVQTLDVESGAVTDLFLIDNVKGGFIQLSPDGQRLAFSEMVFGATSYGIYISNLDGSQKRLVAGGDLSVTATAWSPDSRWLMLKVMQWDGGSTEESAVILHPDTCQIVPLPSITGGVESWIAAP